MGDRIPLVFSTDISYVFPTFVAISSALQCAYEDTRYDIYLQITEECKEKCINMVQCLYNNFSNFNFHFLKMDANLFQDARVINKHVKLPTYYRLMAAEQLSKYEKCIILDSDLLIKDDLRKMYNWQMGDDYIAGVKSWEDQQPTQNNYEHMVRTGLPSMDNYIYSGVLLMNLRTIRQDNLTDKFVEHMNRGYPFDDQDVFNVCCYGKITFLPLRYNLLVRHYKEKFPEGMKIYSESEISQAWNHPAILHYPGALIKPWKNSKVKLGEEWWKAAEIFMDTEEYTDLRDSMHKWTEKLDFQYIVNNIPVGSQIILFGFSDIGKKVYAKLAETRKYHVIGFCDNDIEKQGIKYEQICVYCLDGIQDFQNCYFVITSQRSAEVIKKQLMEREISEDKIFIYLDLQWKYYASLSCAGE